MVTTFMAFDIQNMTELSNKIKSEETEHTKHDVQALASDVQEMVKVLSKHEGITGEDNVEKAGKLRERFKEIYEMWLVNG